MKKSLKHHVKHHVKHHAKAVHQAVKHDVSAMTPLRFIESLVVLIIAIQVLVFCFNTFNTSRPVFGVRLEGKLLGNQYGNEDIKREVQAIIRDYENTPVTVIAANEKSVITMRQLGVRGDEDKAYSKLMATGRTGDFFERVSDQGLALLGRRDMYLGNPNFDETLAKEYVAALNQKNSHAPINAYFAYEKQQIVLHADVKGAIIDINGAVTALRRVDPKRNPQVTLPVVHATADLTESMATPLKPQVERVASKPLKIIAGNAESVVSPEQLVAAVVPKVIIDAKTKVKTTQLSYDEAKLNTVVDELLKRAVVAPKPTIMYGSAVVQQGTKGLRTEDDNTLSRVLSVLIQRQTGAELPDTVTIPLVPVDPPVIQQNYNNPNTRMGTGLVRLTFDDGPGAYTEQVLDILKRYGVHATFYVIGRNVTGHPGTMQRIRDEGHRIGNHSYTHADLTRLSADGVRQELASTQAAIQAACGVTPTAFRPPYGANNQTVRSVAASMGMSVDLWSVDTRDWAQPGSNVITQRVLAGTGPGAVVLLHVLHAQTVNALPSIIQGIRAQGYTLE